MIESGKAYVIGPSVAAYGPYGFPPEQIGLLKQGRIGRTEISDRFEHGSELPAGCCREFRIVLCRIPGLKRLFEIGESIGTVYQLPDLHGHTLAAVFESYEHSVAVFTVVLEQRVAPCRTLALRIGAIGV